MRLILFCLLLFTSLSALSVELANGRPAQVVIVPYFTVLAKSDTGNRHDTLIEVRNESFDEIKAARLVFHESYNGREVLSFNAYIPPAGMLRAAVADLGGFEVRPGLITASNTCTVPQLPSSGNFGGEVAFYDFNFTGANADGGPQTSDRLGEGYIVVYEMGLVDADFELAQAIKDQECDALVDAFLPGGKWDTDPEAGISKPANGTINAKVSLVNVLEGTMRNIPVITLEDFSEDTLHRTPVAPITLNEVNPAISRLTVRGTEIEARWDNPIDAVSSLLTYDSARSNFNANPILGATSDFIVTLPTKPFYTDPAIVGGSPIEPFTMVFGDAEGCESTFTQRVDRAGISASAGDTALCNVANVFAAGNVSTTGTMSGNALSAPEIVEGSVVTLFDRSPDGAKTLNRNVLTGVGGTQFFGLPVIAFSLGQYVNGEVFNDMGQIVISNYGIDDPAITERRISIDLKKEVQQ